VWERLGIGGYRVTQLIKIGGWTTPLRGSAVFVHGLGGHAYNTWQRANVPDSLWPVWIAQDIRGLNVYSLSYPAAPFRWAGTAMPLEDRAVNVLEYLANDPDLDQGPINFICHSLGGLVIKQVIREASSRKAYDPRSADLLGRIKKIVFIATPHTGADQATWLDRSKILIWPTTATQSLVANNPMLRNLNVWYRLAPEAKSIEHLVFYETQGTYGGTIVDPGSGDPGLNVTPIPIDANHIDICKPTDRRAVLYSRIRSFISGATKQSEISPDNHDDAGELQIAPAVDINSPIKSGRTRRIVRLALGLAAIVAFLPAAEGFFDQRHPVSCSAWKSFFWCAEAQSGTHHPGDETQEHTDWQQSNHALGDLAKFLERQ